MTARPRARLGPLFTLGAGACLAHAACTAPAPARSTGPTLDAAEYRLEWALGRATHDASGRLRLTTDLGYEVTLRRGLLATYASSLAECATSPVVAALWPLGPTRARAGHGEAADPSTVAGLVETIGDAVVRTQGTTSFAPKAYCRAHWVAGPADASTAGAAEAGMEGASLIVEGDWSRAGEAGTFAWRSTIATGALDELPALAGPSVVATVVRSADTLLDGVELATTSPSTGSRAVLLNLARQTRIEVQDE